jgi:DNA-binding response OmpR family regulator
MKTFSILLVDDEQHIADVVIYMLKEHGFEVAYAADGDAGLALFKTIRPTLVLLDLNLPGIPGLELFKEIKKIRPDTPVIMLTCRGDEADRVLGLEMGADDYISKPFSARELVARVKGVLRRTKSHSADDSSILKYGPLECDPSAVVMRCANQPVLLTHFEFEVMKTLLKSPGRAFSRDALIRTVYEEGHPVTDRAIDACIKRIRRKFMAVRADLDPITTLYGIGYKLNPALEAITS